MNKVKKLVIILILLILYIYTCNITLLPSSIILMQGEKLNINTVWGLNIYKYDNLETVTTSMNDTKAIVDEIGKTKLGLKLLNAINVKSIDVNVIPKTTVIPLGKAIGMKLYTDGVLVVGMSEIEGKRPYASSGIKEGDMIIQVNNENIKNTEDLISKVNKYGNDDITIKYMRNNETITTSILPTKTQNNEYKLGLWVRDAAAGVGTLTYYEPSTGNFAALGHGIVDVDTLDLIDIANGELVTTNIISINKGKKGLPGEISGTIDAGTVIGNVYKNTDYGVYGVINNKTVLQSYNTNEVEIALRSEIKLGNAEIMCELENGKIEKYKIQIQKIYNTNNNDNKSMLIKIIDEKLLDKTGGIIQRNEWGSNNPG